MMGDPNGIKRQLGPCLTQPWLKSLQEESVFGRFTTSKHRNPVSFLGSDYEKLRINCSRNTLQHQMNHFRPSLRSLTFLLSDIHQISWNHYYNHFYLILTATVSATVQFEFEILWTRSTSFRTKDQVPLCAPYLFIALQRHHCNTKSIPTSTLSSPTISSYVCFSCAHIQLISVKPLLTLWSHARGRGESWLSPVQKEPLIRPPQLNYPVSAGSERLSHLSSITMTRRNSELLMPAWKQQCRLGPFEEQLRSILYRWGNDMAL